jgi:hypothetical protein
MLWNIFVTVLVNWMLTRKYFNFPVRKNIFGTDRKRYNWSSFVYVIFIEEMYIKERVYIKSKMEVVY